MYVSLAFCEVSKNISAKGSMDIMFVNKILGKKQFCDGIDIM